MRRDENNPILTRDAIVGRDVSSVFNPGVVRTADGAIRMVMRVQTRGRETLLYDARSDDGVRFIVAPEPIRIDGLDTSAIYHVYDPRLTLLGDDLYLVFAADTDEGCRLGTARATASGFELIELGPPDVRNGVLFPEKIGDKYMRLERPNDPGGSGAEIWLATSDDLVSWTRVAPLMEGRAHYWDERIGPGPPPVRVDDGWLLIYHGIATHPASGDLYQAGVALLDGDDPWQVLARSRENILEPRELYEMVGQVPNVVFPSGWVVDGDNIKLYYGAADTCVGLAHTTVTELLRQCHD